MIYHYRNPKIFFVEKQQNLTRQDYTIASPCRAPRIRKHSEYNARVVAGPL
jgi:hypothetical protein